MTSVSGVSSLLCSEDIESTSSVFSNDASLNSLIDGSNIEKVIRVSSPHKHSLDKLL